MKHLKHLLLLALLIAFNFGKAQTINPNYCDGKIYFKLKNLSDTIPNYNGTGGTPAYIADLVAKYNVTKLYRPFVSANSTILKSIYRMEFTNFASVEQVLIDLKAKSSTEYAEKIPFDKIFATPNDPLYAANQWSLPKIAAPAAFDLYIPKAGKGVINIAIVDNEIRTTHTDLAAIMIAGRDVADGDNNTNPPNASFNHGTHCAGIAAAATNNAIGIASLNYPVGGINYLKIIPVKVTSDADPNPGHISHGYDGITWAADNGAKVISCSWGANVYDATSQAVIDYAYGKGCIIVAAAGNTGINELNYPASYNHVICVGATDNADVKASFSTYSNAVDVMAPGLGIYSTFSNADNVTYGTLSGTSMACPLTAGLVGLMWSFNPNLSQSALENCLKSSCTNITAQNPSLGGLIGSGRINASQALACINTGQTIFADFTSNITRVCPGQTVNFTDLTGGTVTSWLWNFGDGTPTSTLKNPTHVYNGTVGTVYTVTLTSTSPGGNNTIVKNAYITMASPTAQIVGQGASTVCDNSPQLIKLQFTGNPPFSVTFSNGVTVSNLQTQIISVIISVKQGDSPLTINAMNDVGCTGTIVPGQAIFNFVACCPSIFTNGDFANGNTLTKPANTDFNLSLLFSNTNFNVYNATTSSIGSWPMRPTLPNRGLSMVYDGYGVAPNITPAPAHTRVWCQRVNIVAATNYDMQFFTTDNALAVYGTLEFQVEVNGAFIGTPIAIPPSGGGFTWHQSNVNYISPIALTNAEVCICQINAHHTTAYDICVDDISMRPNIPLTINAGPDISICSGGSAVIGTPSQAGLTYLWTPTTGLSNANIAQPTATPSTTTTYTLVVTNPATGCQSRDEITVTVNTNCCGGPYDYTVPKVGANSSALLAAIGTGGAIIGKTISVQGPLNIDVFTNCWNCTFVMDPGVKIDLTGGDFTLNGNAQAPSHVSACTNMWDGIYVQPGRTLKVLGNTLVEDAINAVVSVGGGTFIIDEAIFNRNLIAIDVRAYSGGTHSGTITNSIITSRALPNSPTVTNLKGTGVLAGLVGSKLKSPYTDRKGCYGINVTDVTNINIGSASTAANLNIFDWIMCGVKLTRSDAIIYNNQFQYMTGSPNPNGCPSGNPGQPVPPCYFESGCGIIATGTANTGTNSITVGNPGTNQRNIFNNTHTAVYVQYYQNNYIYSNTIDNISTGPFTLGTFNYGKYGIYINSPTAYNIIYVASHPLIQNCENAIYVNRNFNNALSTDLYIRSNIIKANTGGYCTNGIYVMDLQNGTYNGFDGSWSIVGNTITEAVNGINLLNVKSPAAAYPLGVKDNVCTVRYATTGSKNGILTKGCDGIQLTLNHTKCNSTAAASAGGNLGVGGIYVESSTHMLLKCNQIDDAARGLVFKGACTSVLTTNSSPQTGITQNTIHKAQDGFVLLTNGIIGSQGSSSVASNNYWDAPANYVRGQTVAEGSAAGNSILYVNNTATTLPTKNIQYGGSAYSSASLLNSSGSPVGCDPVRAAAPAADPTINAVTDYAKELQTMVNDAKKLPVFSDETHWLRNQFVYKELKNNTALQNSNASLQKFYNSTKHNYSKFAQVDDKMVLAQYSNANSINNSIVASNAIESNQKIVNALILKKLLAPNYSYTSSDRSTLNTIAWQCPLSSGNSVYQARVLLMTIANNVIEFTDNCDVSVTQSLEGSTTSVTQINTENKSFKLYPNPNNGNMIFEYSLASQSAGTFVLYDITGRVINKYKLTEGDNNSLKISENELTNGIYFYSVIIDNNVKAYNKIVIVK